MLDRDQLDGLDNRTRHNEPDLQCPGAQNSRSLVLGHIRSGRAILIRYLLLSSLLHDFPHGPGIGVARNDSPFAVDSVSVRIICISIGFPFFLEVFGIDDIFGFPLVELLLSGLVLVTMKHTESEQLISSLWTGTVQSQDLSAVLEESGLTSPQRRDRRRSQTS